MLIKWKYILGLNLEGFIPKVKDLLLQWFIPRSLWANIGSGSLWPRQYCMDALSLKILPRKHCLFIFISCFHWHFCWINYCALFSEHQNGWWHTVLCERNKSALCSTLEKCTHPFFIRTINYYKAIQCLSSIRGCHMSNEINPAKIQLFSMIFQLFSK